ncbi:MAG: hypothetical protein NC093_07855 [Alistipes sp.]|nr:hypothetical protein [Alistipes sp.]
MGNGSRIGRIISAAFNSITACLSGITSLELFREAAALGAKKMPSEREWSFVNNLFVGMGQGIAHGFGVLFLVITLGASAGLGLVHLSKKSEEATNGYSNSRSVALLILSYFTAIIAFFLYFIYMLIS